MDRSLGRLSAPSVEALTVWNPCCFFSKTSGVLQSTPHYRISPQTLTVNTVIHTHRTHTTSVDTTPATAKRYARDTRVNYVALPELQKAPWGNQPFNASPMRI